jgi:hypothetical protein
MVGQEAGQDGRTCMMFDDRLMDTAADFSCLGRECWLQDVAVVASSLRGKSCSVLRVYRDRCCGFVIDRLTTIKVERTVFFRSAPLPCAPYLMLVVHLHGLRVGGSELLETHD